MHMHRCLGTRRPMAIVHAQQILGRAERGNGSDLRDLRSAGRCPTLRTENEKPRFASDLSSQRRQSIIADGVAGSSDKAVQPPSLYPMSENSRRAKTTRLWEVA